MAHTEPTPTERDCLGKVALRLPTGRAEHMKDLIELLVGNIKDNPLSVVIAFLGIIIASALGGGLYIQSLKSNIQSLKDQLTNQKDRLSVTEKSVANIQREAKQEKDSFKERYNVRLERLKLEFDNHKKKVSEKLANIERYTERENSSGVISKSDTSQPKEEYILEIKNDIEDIKKFIEDLESTDLLTPVSMSPNIDVQYVDIFGDRLIAFYWADFTTFIHDGLVSNPIYQDPDGAIWFGSQGAGISKYHGEDFIGEDFITFTTDDIRYSPFLKGVYISAGTPVSSTSRVYRFTRDIIIALVILTLVFVSLTHTLVCSMRFVHALRLSRWHQE